MSTKPDKTARNTATIARYRAKKKEQGLVMLAGLYCKPEHRQAIRDFAKKLEDS